VVHGGGAPHRIGLFDAVLIKDNHIAAAGGLKEAVAAVTDRLGDDTDIEVEVDTIEQLREAMDTRADSALLDNMTPGQVRQCVELVDGRLRLEASGGIDLDNVREYAETGVDMISVGHLTRSAPGTDFSLEVSG
jgi:nicotinate-nucleotide pyrophosphorylase (carboxylating)